MDLFVYCCMEVNYMLCNMLAHYNVLMHSRLQMLALLMYYNMHV